MTLTCPKCVLHGVTLMDITPTGRMEQQTLRGRNRVRAQLRCGTCGFLWRTAQPEALAVATAAGGTVTVIDPGAPEVANLPPMSVTRRPHEQAFVSVTALARSSRFRDGKALAIGEDR